MAIGVLASLIFSATYFVASLIANRRNWRAFSIVNGALIVLFGGLELDGLLTIGNNPATRFGGYELSAGGHITAAGFASLGFDIAICTLSNFLGFWFARVLIYRLNLNQRA